MSRRPIQLSPPYFDTDLSRDLLMGEPRQIIRRFEKDIAKYIRRKYAVAVNSGTSAIHLALKGLGMGKGDIVLCQSMTYAATAFPILYEGAVPVFIDSEPDTWNMDSELLRKSIEQLLANGQKPAAIILVDLYGMPAKMNEILNVAVEYDIPVVEDAAEAFGAKFRQNRCGGFGKVSILSFNSNKVITSGGGGMLLTDEKKIANRAAYFASQAKDSGSVMNHREVGHNYRMNHVNASLGLQQFAEIEERIEHRKKVFGFYCEHIGQLPGITFSEEIPHSSSNRWLSTMLVDPQQTGGITRTDIEKALAADHIESRPLWKPMHLQPVFKGAKAYVNGTSEKLFEQGLCLPSGYKLSEEDLDRIAKVVRGVFEKAKS